jgi:hypothetical protein
MTLDAHVGTGTHEHALIGRIVAVARRLWPHKTAAELAWRSSRSVRSCERWASRHAGLSAGALAALLRSPEGPAFMSAVMGDNPPQWWADAQAHIERAALRRRGEEIRARIAALERGDPASQDASQGLSRAARQSFSEAESGEP